MLSISICCLNDFKVITLLITSLMFVYLIIYRDIRLIGCKNANIVCAHVELQTQDDRRNIKDVHNRI